MSAKIDLMLMSSSRVVTKGRSFLKSLNAFTQEKSVHPFSLTKIFLLAHLLFWLPEKLRRWEKDWKENAENKEKNLNKDRKEKKRQEDGKYRWKSSFNSFITLKSRKNDLKLKKKRMKNSLTLTLHSSYSRTENHS